ncbi:MAG TPA: hypothetical protein VFY14_12300 [Streptomyces sp.]|nr:hypothetical protein [Streptomyces sp.]
MTTPEERGDQFFRAEKDVQRLLEHDATPWSIVYALWGRYRAMTGDHNDADAIALKTALTALDRVRALHVRNQNTGDCEHCSERDYPNYAVPWPCPTIHALNGPQEQS